MAGSLHAVCVGVGVRVRMGGGPYFTYITFHYVTLLTVRTQYITIHYMAATCRGLGRGRVGTGGGGGVGVAAGKRVGELPTACAFAFVCVAMQF